MSTSIADIRTDYKQKSLLESDVAANPFDQFESWWNEAVNSHIEEVNAMTLATSTSDGMPSARIVLLKGFSREGFVFFTNYNSYKATQMAQNPNVSLVFFWKEIERQVRIEGTVSKVSEVESDVYFSSRPDKSKLGAWASPQSQPISSRQWLEDSYKEAEQRFADNEIKRPPHWGGYLVKPKRIEFWQGRRSRLHDRILYTPAQDGWKLERLAP